MSGPVYTFTPNTPNAGDAQNTTTSLIRANFQAMNELINVNHVGFNSTGAGKHNLLTMEFQSADPGTAATDLALYTKATGSPNAAEIFYQYPNNGTVQQLTPSSAAGSGGTSAATGGTGWCQFPSGIIMRWGQNTITSTPSGNGFAYPTGSGQPSFKTIVAFASGAPAVAGVVQNFSNCQLFNYGYGVQYFLISGISQGVLINWLAIGI